MPGVEISLAALTSRGARLPQVDLLPPRAVIGKSTVDAIRSGVIYGFAGAIDGILRRLLDELGDDTDVIATGGLARRDRPVHRAHRRGRRHAHADRAAPVVRAQRLTTLKAMPRTLNDPWQLAHLHVPNRVVLAPLAGIGNWFVRLQAKRYGAGMVVSEMVSSFGVHHGNEKTTTEMLRIEPAERAGGPVAIQLFGQEPDVMRSAAATIARDTDADFIDLNMGCPVPKVCKTGAGAALIDDPDLAVAVARAAREGSGLPVTVKIRSGRRVGDARRLRPRPPARRRGRRRGDRLSPALGAGAPQGLARPRPRPRARRRRSTRR